MKFFKIYTQDAFNFPGCMPEGDGPQDNGDTFDNRDDALAEAKSYIRGILNEDQLGLSVDDRRRAIAKAEKELDSTGECGLELPYYEEDEEEFSDKGYRFVSVAIAEEDDGIISACNPP